MRRFGRTLPQAQSSCAGSEGGQSPACEAGTEGGRLLGDTANFSQLCLKVFPRQKHARAMQSHCTCQISTGHPALICVSPSAYIYWLKSMKDINHFFRSQVPICRNLHIILQEISKKSQGYRFIPQKANLLKDQANRQCNYCNHGLKSKMNCFFFHRLKNVKRIKYLFTWFGFNG